MVSLVNPNAPMLSAFSGSEEEGNRADLTQFQGEELEISGGSFHTPAWHNLFESLHPDSRLKTLKFSFVQDSSSVIEPLHNFLDSNQGSELENLFFNFSDEGEIKQFLLNLTSTPRSFSQVKYLGVSVNQSPEDTAYLKDLPSSTKSSLKRTFPNLDQVKFKDLYDEDENCCSCAALMFTAMFGCLGVKIMGVRTRKKLIDYYPDIVRGPLASEANIRKRFGSAVLEFSKQDPRGKFFFMHPFSLNEIPLDDFMDFEEGYGYSFALYKFITDLRPHCDLKYKVISHPSQICEEIARESKAVGKLAGLILNFHGDENSMLFRNATHNNSFDTQALLKNLPKSCFDGLSPTAVINLFSCSTGRGSSPIAKALADHSGRVVRAPIIPISANRIQMPKSKPLEFRAPYNVKDVFKAFGYPSRPIPQGTDVFKKFYPPHYFPQNESGNVCPVPNFSHNTNVATFGSLGLVTPSLPSTPSNFSTVASIASMNFNLLLCMGNLATGLTFSGWLMDKATDYTSPFIRRAFQYWGLYDKKIGNFVFRFSKFAAKLSSESGSVLMKATNTALWAETKGVAKISRFTGHVLEQATKKTLGQTESLYFKPYVKYLTFVGSNIGKALNLLGKGLDWASDKAPLFSTLVFTRSFIK